MDLFDQLAVYDHEQVIAIQNRATGLRGFLAIHDTTLGPALAACGSGATPATPKHLPMRCSSHAR